jgi:DNA-directed RNA polymerase subunit RPC12/RpoP
MELEAKHVLTAPNVVCPNCGSKLFTEAVVLKKLSPIISPTGREELYPIPVYMCAKCQTIPDEYMTKHNAKRVLGEEVNDEQEEEPKKSSIIMP